MSKSTNPKPKPSSRRTEKLAESKTFAFIEEFIKHLQDQDKSSDTQVAYRNDLTHFTRWLSTTRDETYKNAKDLAQAITPTDVRQYRDYLLKTEKIAPSTINRRVIVLRSFTRWARQKGWIEGDPINGIKQVKQVELAPRWLDRKEQLALRRATEKDGNIRNLAIITLMLNTGLRVSEVAGLTLDDVTLTERKGELRVRGKGTKVRTVPLNPEARKVLKAYLDRRPESESRAVFLNQSNMPLKREAIEWHLRELGHLARIERLTPHVLRHTFAKNLIDAGVSIDHVAQLLGHRNLSTTARYTQPSSQDLAQDVSKLSGDGDFTSVIRNHM
jgi:site-specific recombinase XerD